MPAPDLTVAALLSRWPQTIPVFLRHRMACVGYALARFESLAAVTTAYGLPLDGFVMELQSSIPAAPGRPTQRSTNMGIDKEPFIRRLAKCGGLMQEAGLDALLLT